MYLDRNLGTSTFTYLGSALVLVPGQTPRHFYPHVLGVPWLRERTGSEFVSFGTVPFLFTLFELAAVFRRCLDQRRNVVPPFGGFPVSSDFRVLATLSSVCWEGRHPGDEVETGDVGVRNWCQLLTLGVARDSSGSCVPIGTQGESPRRSSLRCGYGGDMATQCWLWGDGAFGTDLWGTWFGHSTGVGHHYS